jgi:putative transposase
MRLPTPHRTGKSAVAVTRDTIWQSRYYDHNLYLRPKSEEKLTYMHQNPVRAGLVTRSIDWPWCSSRFYELGEDVGVPIQWVE